MSLLGNVYATPYQGKIIDSDSIFIQFGDDTLGFGGKAIPIIERAEIKVSGSSLQLENPEFRVMGNSFALKSLNDDFGVIIYGLNQGYSFNLRSIMFIENQMIKFNDHSTLKTPEIKQTDITPNIDVKDAQKPILAGIVPNILVDHYDYVTKGYEYRFEVKAFDSKIYNGNNFEEFRGKLDNVHVTASILLGNEVKKTFDGFTKYGIFEDGVLINVFTWPQGKYTLKVNTDFEGKTSSKELEFFVSEQSSKGSANRSSIANNSPIANAGPDQIVLTSSQVTLNGLGSSDPDGDNLTFSWIQKDGTPVTLSDNSIANPTFTLEGSRPLTFSLTVSDGKLISSPDEITVFPKLNK